MKLATFSQNHNYQCLKIIFSVPFYFLHVCLFGMAEYNTHGLVVCLCNLLPNSHDDVTWTGICIQDEPNIVNCIHNSWNVSMSLITHLISKVLSAVQLTWFWGFYVRTFSKYVWAIQIYSQGFMGVAHGTFSMVKFCVLWYCFIGICLLIYYKLVYLV